MFQIIKNKRQRKRIIIHVDGLIDEYMMFLQGSNKQIKAVTSNNLYKANKILQFSVHFFPSFNLKYHYIKNHKKYKRKMKKSKIIHIYVQKRKKKKRTMITNKPMLHQQVKTLVWKSPLPRTVTSQAKFQWSNSTVGSTTAKPLPLREK